LDCDSLCLASPGVGSKSTPPPPLLQRIHIVEILHDAASALSLPSELLELEAAKLKRMTLPASIAACPRDAAAVGGGTTSTIDTLSLSPFLTLALVVGAAASLAAASTQRATTFPFSENLPHACILK
jgi:hypothetical protein